MARLGQRLKEYRENARTIRRLYHNPLKNPVNISQKDRLERDFYDNEAEKFLIDFDAERFTYREDEPMPRSHLFLYSLVRDIAGARVLDICCGHGIATVRCAKRGATVTGIDISPRMLELARRNVELNGVANNVDLQLMSVHDMAFPDGTFDYVIGLGALHHLNPDQAGRDIARVLRPGGRAIFLEPRVPYKWLMLMRSLIPVRCLESPGGGRLSDDDIASFESHFASCRIDYFFLLRKLARFPILMRFADTFDQWDGRNGMGL